MTSQLNRFSVSFFTAGSGERDTKNVAAVMSLRTFLRNSAFSLRQKNKVHSFLEHSCAILNSFKIVIIFNNTSADFVFISADVLLKMITILKELY